jgi:sugar phosphate isomerase/epimerase
MEYRENIMMKLGCNTVLFNQLDLYGALQHIAWAGYDGAEIACQEEWAKHVELKTDPEYIAEIKYAVKKHGLKLFAIQAAFVALPDPEKIKQMTKVFDVAQALNIPVVTTRSFGESGDKEGARQEFKFFKTLCDLAGERGVMLSVKPHRGALVYNAATVMQMVETVNSPHLGVTCDPLHLTKGGDNPVDAIAKIGKQIVHCHFHDCPAPQPTHDTPEQQVPGRSTLDWHNIIKELKNVGYDRACDVHIIGAFQYPLSRQMGLAAEARGYLNRCLQEVK